MQAKMKKSSHNDNRQFILGFPGDREINYITKSFTYNGEKLKLTTSTAHNGILYLVYTSKNYIHNVGIHLGK